MTNTMDAINRLSAQRAELHRMALNGHRGDPEIRRRLDAVSAELDILWDARRRERAGRLEGIDLLVDRSYAQIYGRDYRDAVAPPSVEQEEDNVAALVA